MRLPSSLPARIALIVAAALVLFLVAAQLFLPGIGEGAIEDRLTEHGGVAEVSLSAVPAARLLWGDGDELSIDASGLDLELTDDVEVFENIDPFGDVEIAITDSTAGPVKLDSFFLTRSGDGPYELRSSGTGSAAELASYGVESADLPGAGLVGALLELTGVGGADLPVELDLSFVSDPDGRVRVIDGGGTVAGVPTGPLAELITAAIVVQL